MAKKDNIIFTISTRQGENASMVINLSKDALDSYEIIRHPLQENEKNEKIATDIKIKGRLAVNITRNGSADQKTKKENEKKSKRERITGFIKKQGRNLINKNLGIDKPAAEKVSNNILNAVEAGGKLFKTFIAKPDVETVDNYPDVSENEKTEKKLPFGKFTRFYKDVVKLFNNVVERLNQEDADEIMNNYLECASTADAVQVIEDCASKVIYDNDVLLPDNEDEAKEYIELLECLLDELLKYFNKGIGVLEKGGLLGEFLLVAYSLADHIGEKLNIESDENYELETDKADGEDKGEKVGFPKKLKKQAMKQVEDEIGKLKDKAKAILDAAVAWLSARNIKTDMKPEYLVEWALRHNGEPACYMKVDHSLEGVSIKGLESDLLEKSRDLGVFYVVSYVETFDNNNLSVERGLGSFEMLLRRHTFLQ